MIESKARTILNFAGNAIDDLKAAFRKAALKAHPDTIGSNENYTREFLKKTEEMKQVNRAKSVLDKIVGKNSDDDILRNFRMCDDADSVLDKISGLEGLKATICGTWVWVSGPCWLYKKLLKAAGLHPKRGESRWYWKPAGYVKRSNRTWSFSEVKDRFGEETAFDNSSPALAPA